MVKNNKEKGVSLIMTFFIMIIILSVVLAISIILYSEIKIIRNMGNSVVSFYAAESGIEKVLYYDRQVVPEGAIRGLCSMFDQENNEKYCQDSGYEDEAIYCKNSDTEDIEDGGCDIETCNNCKIYFETTFNDKKYFTTVLVYPNQEIPDESDFEIISKGAFGGTQRNLQVLIYPGSN